MQPSMNGFTFIVAVILFINGAWSEIRVRPVTTEHAQSLIAAAAGAGTGELKGPTEDPTCRFGIASEDHTVCCSANCWSCTRSPMCDNATKYTSFTGQKVTDCCAGYIVERSEPASCDKGVAPCRLSLEFRVKYEKGLKGPISEKRHVHNLRRVKQREFRAKLFNKCKKNYDFGMDTARQVGHLCAVRVETAKKKVIELEGRIAEEESNKTWDPFRKANIFVWHERILDNKDKATFYGQIRSNAIRLASQGQDGLETVETMKNAINLDVERIDSYEPKVRKLELDSERVYDEAQKLLQQWVDARKDYNCAIPAVEHHAYICNQTTTVSRVCPITCKPGYDGNGTINTLRCRKVGKYGEKIQGILFGTAACVGRNCGKPPAILKATAIQQDIIYPHAAWYTCFEGHTVDGSARGDKKFSTPCGTKGLFPTSVLTLRGCQPVRCGSAPRVDNALPASGTYVFQQKASITCQEGFTVDGTAGGASKFQVSCQATGHFSPPQACRPVSCGSAPVYLHTAMLSKGGPQFYAQKLWYTCEKGYTLNHKAKGPATFILRCGADGEFSAMPPKGDPPKRSFLGGEAGGASAFLQQTGGAFPMVFSGGHIPKCRPVSAGIPPKVANGMLARKVMFYGDKQTVLADTGYSTVARADAGLAFVLSATAEGSFAGMDEFEKVSCGATPSVGNAVKMFAGDTAVYKDLLEYACKPGYSTDASDDDSAKKFAITCESDGTYSKVPDTGLCVDINDCLGHTCGPMGRCVDKLLNYTCDCDKGFEVVWNKSLEEYTCNNRNDCGPEACGLYGKCKDLIDDYTCLCDTGYELTENIEGKTCVAISCGVFPAVENALTSPPMAGFSKAFYKQSVMYKCETGHSLDGTVKGKRQFSVGCNADKTLDPVSQCKPISCGVAPKVDHATIGGPKAPPLYVLGKKGQNSCPTGYTSVSRAECAAAVRAVLPPGAKQGRKPLQQGSWKWVPPGCSTQSGGDWASHYNSGVGPNDGGYTTVCKKACDWQAYLNRYPDLQKAFGKTNVARAKKHWKDHGEKEKRCCVLGACPAPAKVDHATTVGGPKVFNQSVTYTCAKGYTVDATALGDKSFAVTCQAGGAYGTPLQCKRISCGEPPDVANAVRTAGDRVFEDTVTYKCFDGFTLDGDAKSDKEFKTTCSIDGTFTTVQNCNPVICGHPAKEISVLHATVPDMGKLVYPLVAEITCRDGYSVGGDPSADQSFVVKCGSKGKFESYDPGACKPMKCASLKTLDLPNATLVGSSVAGADSLVFGLTAIFSCRDGFTAGGEFGAPKKVRAACSTSGALTIPSPELMCRNLDECEKHTCGPKGTCIDLIGPGAYTCDCEKGYELQTSDGEKYCGNIDDCKGHTCGMGVCKDLLDDYTCMCPIGYNLGTKDGEKTCIPVLCRELVPTVSNAKLLTTMVGGPVVFPTTLSYQCSEGHSVDGSPVEAKTKFQASCKSNAQLLGMQACMPISCGAPRVLPFTDFATDLESGDLSELLKFDVKYGQVVKYACADGYNVFGSPSGATTFTTKCLSSGVLSDPGVCVPVTCGKAPTIAKSTPSIAGIVSFGMHLKYHCHKGHTLTGTALGDTSFDVKCLKTGKFDLTVATATCKPLSVDVPLIKDAVIAGLAGDSSVSWSSGLKAEYPAGVEYKCKSGFSLTGRPGGATKIVSVINSMGEFMPALPAKCERITFTVAGYIKDSLTGGGLEGAFLSIEGFDGLIKRTERGFFNFKNVPGGTYKVKYHREGYITTEKSLTISSDIFSGGIADVSMSPKMRSDQWRATVQWGRFPQDLDSYGKWGSHTVSWRGRSLRASGLGVKLEHDDTNGYGPETVYFTNVGKCRGRAYECDIKYEIHDYSQSRRLASDSKARVTLYNGDTTAGTWNIGDCGDAISPDKNWWHVFTISGSTGKLKWHCGMSASPLLSLSVGANSTSPVIDFESYVGPFPGQFYGRFGKQHKASLKAAAKLKIGLEAASFNANASLNGSFVNASWKTLDESVSTDASKRLRGQRPLKG